MITERRIILQFSTFLRVRAITNGITKCVQPLRSEFFGSYLVRNIQNMRAREGAQLQFDIGRCVIIIALTYPFLRRTTTKEKNYSSLARSGSSTRFRNFRNPCLEPCIPSSCFIVYRVPRSKGGRIVRFLDEKRSFFPIEWTRRSRYTGYNNNVRWNLKSKKRTNIS